MVDPTTVNSCLSIPIRGTDVGTWDLPVNANTNAIDSMFGGVTTIVLAAAGVTMTSTQGQSSVIRFTGTIASDIGVILSPIIKGWTIDNQITNSPSSFAVFLFTPGSSYSLGCPPGHHDVFYDGVGIYHRNMGRIGEYWDYASSAVPRWVNSTKPPWLNCNGTVFSSATYPILTSILGSTTLPDTRGRARMAMNQGTSRVTIFNGDTIYLGGGDQQVQSHDHGGATGNQSPTNHTHGGTTDATNPAHTHTGTTDTKNTDHTHGGTTNAADRSLDHAHSNASASANISTTGGGGFATGFTTSANTGNNTTSIDHLHTFTTNFMNSNQTHTHTFTTATANISHTHTFTSGFQSVSHTHSITAFGTGASLNMPPTLVHGITMIRAA